MDRACEFEVDPSHKKLPEIQIMRNSRYNSSLCSSPFQTLYGFTTRIGQSQVRHPLHKLIADPDRHAQVSNNLKLAKQYHAFHANQRRNHASR